MLNNPTNFVQPINQHIKMSFYKHYTVQEIYTITQNNFEIHKKRYVTKWHSQVMKSISIGKYNATFAFEKSDMDENGYEPNSYITAALDEICKIFKGITVDKSDMILDFTITVYWDTRSVEIYEEEQNDYEEEEEEEEQEIDETEDAEIDESEEDEDQEDEDEEDEETKEVGTSTQ